MIFRCFTEKRIENKHKIELRMLRYFYCKKTKMLIKKIIF